MLIMGNLVMRKDLTQIEIENILKWFDENCTYRDAVLMWANDGPTGGADSVDDYLVIAFDDTFNGYSDSVTLPGKTEKDIQAAIDVMYQMIDEVREEDERERMSRD